MIMMMRGLQIMGLAVVLMAISPLPGRAMDNRCAECGMTVTMDSPFIAKIFLSDRTLYFCDIGDLFVYLTKKNLKDARSEVKDYTTGAWIDARKAYYVHSEKKFRTPMAWGVAAFKDKSEASQSGAVMDFDAAARIFK